MGSTTANQFVFQADYVNPISETKKFEAGIKAFYKNSISANNTSRLLEMKIVMERYSYE
ncbi:MAG: outer membrane beta-barrel protein [Bacteroidetes bacterium]|nr:outer membrane beta-barrel protein [Bacteroidota bacterium]